MGATVSWFSIDNGKHEYRNYYLFPSVTSMQGCIFGHQVYTLDCYAYKLIFNDSETELFEPRLISCCAFVEKYNGQFIP